MRHGATMTRRRTPRGSSRRSQTISCCSRTTSVWPSRRRRASGSASSISVRAPEARGTGVAADLVRQAASALRDRGAEVLELEVLQSNERARAVYARWSFSPVELTLAAPIDALVRRLDPAAGGPTFGSVHVQTDDVTTVERAVQKVLPRLGRSEHTKVSGPRQRLGHRARRARRPRPEACCCALRRSSRTRTAAWCSHSVSRRVRSCATRSSTAAPSSTSTRRCRSTTGRCRRAR